MGLLAAVGRAVRRFLEHLGNLGRLTWLTVSHALLLRLEQLPLVLQQVRSQIRFTGLDALGLICGSALLLGAVTLIQAYTQLSGLGAEKYVGSLMVLIVIRELGPLLTAVVVIGRSGTAIAAEMGTMRLNREVDALMVHGVDPYQYLLLPRALGVVASSFALLVFFDATALLGGWFVARLKQEIAFGFFLHAVREALLNRDFLASLCKVGAFSGAIAFHAAYFGLRIRSSQTEIPQAVTKTVVTSLVAVLLADGLITALFYF
jgi:phospholipid/cholesterol/gamma-HCH transport system permease protein